MYDMKRPVQAGQMAVTGMAPPARPAVKIGSGPGVPLATSPARDATGATIPPPKVPVPTGRGAAPPHASVRAPKLYAAMQARKAAGTATNPDALRPAPAAQPTGFSAAWDKLRAAERPAATVAAPAGPPARFGDQRRAMAMKAMKTQRV